MWSQLRPTEKPTRCQCDLSLLHLLIFWRGESYCIWMNTFLSLDGGGKALDVPQGRVPCPFLGLEGERRGDVGVWEEIVRRGDGGNFVFNFI